jgi:hypothetical protein
LRRAAPPTILDEPTRAFQLPETPPGLQAFLVHLPSRPPPASTSSAAPADVVDAERDALAAAGSTPPNAADIDALDAEWFSPPGPLLPGQARLQAVWRRAVWRALGTRITAHAPTLQDPRGRWIGELAPGWFARTLGTAPDARAGRRAFAEEVLRQRRLARYLSRPRSVVLSEESGRFWVWQVAARVPTLATVLRTSLNAEPSPTVAAAALLDASLAFVDARDRFGQARVPLPLALETLSRQDGTIVYAGLMPDPDAVYAEPPGNGAAAFESSLRQAWPDAPCERVALLEELREKAAGKLPEPLLTIIQSVVEGR